MFQTTISAFFHLWLHSLSIKDMIIRVEEPQDYRASEEVTREAFWNLWAPGADEHFILHRLRNQPEFARELCLVAEIAGQIVGCIAYSTSVILDESDVEQSIDIWSYQRFAGSKRIWCWIFFDS